MQPIEQRAMSARVIETIEQAGVVAVLVIDEIRHAVPLAQALMKGGVDAIELTLRTPVAIDALKAIREDVPGMTLGVGTVLTKQQVKAVKEAGADFAVAPGCNPTVLMAAYDYGLSFAPGIMTPSDIEIAVEHGCRVLKFFPAETSGGIKHLSSMAAPYQYLGLKFIPLGGLRQGNASAYLESPLVTAIGGSWIANRSLIQAENWDTITANARAIRELIQEIRAGA